MNTKPPTGCRTPTSAKNAWSSDPTLYVLLGATLVVFLAPFFRGLYFTGEQLVAIMVSLAIFAVGTVLRRGEPLFSGTFDYLVLAWPVAYLLALPGAVDVRAAIQSILLGLMYLAVFWVISRFARQRFELRAVLSLLVVSLAVVALIGLGAATGDIHFPGAYIWNRVASTVQYPNTAAVLLLVGFLLALGLWIQATTRAGRLLYAALISLFPVAFVYTLSRGTWLVAPLSAIVFWLALPRGERWRGFLLALAGLLGSVPGILLFPHSLGHPAFTWSLVLLGLVLTVALGEAATWFVRRDTALQKRLAAVLLTLVVVGLGAFLAHRWAGPLKLAPGASVSVPIIPVQANTDYRLTLEVGGPAGGAWQAEVIGVDPQGGPTTLESAKGSAGPTWRSEALRFRTQPLTASLLIKTIGAGSGAYFRQVMVAGGGRVFRPTYKLSKLLPGSLSQRAAEINPHELSVWERFYYYRDALKMAGVRPLLGWGGGGWSAAYMTYQTFGYFSTQVHNEFLQALVEAGLVGFLVFIGIWVVWLVVWWRLAKQLPTAERILLAGAGAGVAALGLHALMDFDLSLGAASLLLFTLLGLFRAQEKPSKAGALYAAPVWPISGAVIVILSSLSLLFGFLAAQAGNASYRAGQIQSAISEFQTAVQRDPFSASSHLDLGQAEMVYAQQTQQSTLAVQAVADLARANQLQQYNPMNKIIYGAALFNGGRITEGLNLLQASIANRPFNIEGYEDLAQAYNDVGAFDLQKGLLAKARPYYAKILTVRTAAAAVRRRLPPGVPANLNLPPDTPILHLYYGMAETVLGRYPAATKDLQAAQGVPNQEVARQIWLLVVDTLSHQTVAAETGLKSLTAQYPSAINDYRTLLNALAPSSRKNPTVSGTTTR